MSSMSEERVSSGTLRAIRWTVFPSTLGIFLAGGFIGMHQRPDFGGFLIGCFGGLAVDGILVVLFFVVAGLGSARSLPRSSASSDGDDRSAA